MSQIEQQLIAERSELTPNTDAHIQASQYFWGQYPSRVLQAALQREIIDETWLESTGNTRNCQHLFFVEQDKLVALADSTDESS